jgi:hypothetical protein
MLREISHTQERQISPVFAYVECRPKKFDIIVKGGYLTGGGFPWKPGGLEYDRNILYIGMKTALMKPIENC